MSAPAASVSRSWFARQRWLLLRRVSQLAILVLFLAGPWFGVWMLKGNLSASLVFDTIPLTDPFLILQAMVAGHWPYATALTGGAIMLAFYLFVGGRVFCSWVCPVNMVTDAAAWSRRKMGIKSGRVPDANTRYWLLAGMLFATAISGVLVWEWVNPVSLLHRALIFGLWGALLAIAGIFAYDLLIASRGWCGHLCPVNMVTDAAAWSRRKMGIKSGRVPDANTRYWLLAGMLFATAISGVLVWEWVNPVSLLHRALIFGLWGALLAVAGIFAYDLLIASRGWCGHLCPVGAFYGLIGRTALIRVSAAQRQACDDCMDCFTVCPEPQVIRPALKKAGQTHPLILSGDCTNCGRCIDVCDRHVFKMTHRFDQRSA